jgi:hypothetical protein
VSRLKLNEKAAGLGREEENDNAEQTRKSAFSFQSFTVFAHQPSLSVFIRPDREPSGIQELWAAGAEETVKRVGRSGGESQRGFERESEVPSGPQKRGKKKDQRGPRRKLRGKFPKVEDFFQQGILKSNFYVFLNQFMNCS